MLKGKLKTFNIILNVVILAGVAWAAVKYLNGAEVIGDLKNFNWRYLPLIFLLSTFSFYLKGIRFWILFDKPRPLSRGTIIKAYLAGQSATLIPGGIALRAALLYQLGVPVGTSAAPILFSSLLDQLIFFFGLLAAAAGIANLRSVTLILLVAILVIGILILVPFTRKGILDGMHKLAHRFNFGKAWTEFLGHISKVIFSDILWRGVGFTVLSALLMILTLKFVLLGLGLDIAYPIVALAYIIPAMTGAITFLPAGLGVVEVGMLGIILTAYPETSPEQVIAAITVFRIFGTLLHVLTGAAVYFLAWRKEVEANAQS